jgi:3-hydroxyacyl-[acyl-carrier-protein] dehydratase
MPPPKLFPVEEYDYDNPMFDLEEIRRVNPQRHEMEQLTGIVHVAPPSDGIVGFKDVTDKEFWIRGHMPGFPLMPGVVLCECAAQLAGFFARKYNLLDGDFLGFGGMSNVKFRVPVYPNCRLILAAHVTKVRPKRRAEFQFQGFVDGTMFFSGEMIGVPVHRDQKPA